MATRKITFEVGEYYHLYNRGNDKREIFVTDDDRQRFICSLYATNGTEPIHLSNLRRWSDEVWDIVRGETLVDIGAYCLMPNHFHLLVREKEEGGITAFMLKLLTGYSSYFNLKHERTGKLFEGTFKAIHVNDDAYLKYLYAYIHLNPVKVANSDGWPTKIVKDFKLAKTFLDHYTQSSYHDYLGRERKEVSILNRSEFPLYFEGEPDFREFIDDWMRYDGQPK